jgi:hypothetical protein
VLNLFQELHVYQILLVVPCCLFWRYHSSS